MNRERLGGFDALFGIIMRCGISLRKLTSFGIGLWGVSDLPP